jgi:putative MATE family efflux protein
MNPYERMTTEPVRNLTLKLALPSMASMLITTIYNMVDTWFVARLGTQATAAVGISFAIMELINALGFLFGTGSGTKVGLLLGGKDREGASVMASTACFCAAILSLVLAAVGLVFLSPLMRILGSTASIQPYAESYGRFILIGFPVMSLSLVLSSVLRSEGKNRQAMVGIGCGGILNMLLDPLFIFTFKGGIAGAALATFLSQCIGLCILLSFFLRGKTETRLSLSAIHPTQELMAGIMRAGLPSLCRHGAGMLAAACLNVAAGLYGGDSLIAAFSIVAKVIAFILALIKGFTQGAQSIYSYNKGAGRNDRIREAYLFTLRWNMIGVCLIAALLYFAAPGILSLFSATDSETRALGITALRLHAAGLIFMPYGFAMSILLQAVGESGKSTFLACLPQGICYVPLAFLLPYLFGTVGLMLTPLVAYLLTDIITIPFARSYFSSFL